MQPPLSRTEGKLPGVRIIGFTGHRHLKNPEAVAAALKSELAALQKAGGELVAISSIAIGADTLFAEEVIRAGIKWIVVLPMPRELFREDFTAEEWARAERLIGQAAEVRILDGIERPQVYVDGGKATVDNSDCLFAVWDGKPAQGPGGTAQIVAYAQRLGRKITLFREGGSGTEKIDPAAHSLEFKPEDLLETMGPRPELPPAPQSLRDHFKACDEEAARTAPNFRIGTLSMAAFHLAATLAAGLALAMHAHHFSFPTIYLSWAKVGFVSAALVILFLLWYAHKHEIWLRRRREAEYCRSILATWHCRDFIEPGSFDELPELRDLARSALFLRLEKDPRAAVDIKDFRTAYAHDRVMGQLKYFRREGDRAEAKAGPLRLGYLYFTLIAFACSVILLALRFGSNPFVTENFASSSRSVQVLMVLIDASPLAFPAMASFTLTWIAIEDVYRRAGRFRDLQEKMRMTLIDLSLCGTWEGLRHSVMRTERILFNEVLEWHSIARYSATD
jgi:hypothetical protein